MLYPQLSTAHPSSGSEQRGHTWRSSLCIKHRWTQRTRSGGRSPGGAEREERQEMGVVPSTQHGRTQFAAFPAATATHRGTKP